jgi:light-regulated signal transduction histidine kinase (bacteriophytochrome)
MTAASSEIRKLKNIIRDLERKNEELERFVSHATHDIKEPLRSIAIGCEILLKKYKDSLNDESIKLLQMMYDAAKRFENTVTALKQYTKADAGRLKIERVYVTKVVEAVLNNLKLLTTSKNATVVVGELPQIETDKNKLQVVLHHIIDNALKYHGSSSPYVTISSQVKKNQVIIQIQDKGIGIRPEQKKRILLPFERLHSKFQIEGLGLGLPLCMKVLRRLNGKLKIYSSEGEGTTVQIILPKRYA